ncbi:MAG TPA: OmpA family protein [Povalibacter sp.]|uniref:OmpA family protein n=1 Tax=Povalibacter sp. TaxID=1962978 RepID=UPI002BA7C9BE|nr:OmpA family protein [Povalibacter sp.]HMN47038.1 OmpA family protein [Povalibacter sp.]
MKGVALAVALALPALASASDVGDWYLTPQFGGVSVDNDRPVQDKDWLYGLAFGKHVSQNLSIELNVDGSQIGGGPGRSDLSLWGTSLNFLGVMNRDSAFSPYISVGAGALSNERSPGSNATDLMGQAGVGAFIRLWEAADGSNSFSLRPDLKARWSDAGAENDLVDYIGTIGFQFSFGSPAPKPVAAPEPAPAPVAPTPPPPPPPPGDEDKDGVLDPADQCPGTPAGVAVDAKGCPRQGSITLEGVTFETNSANLTSDSRGVLDAVATDLKKYPNLRIELQGHTDSSGSDAYNLKLSQQRAESVRGYLVQQGVAASQLAARGYGETQPIDDNGTAEGRLHNRRVVMLVLDNPGQVKVEGAGTVTK